MSFQAAYRGVERLLLTAAGICDSIEMMRYRLRTLLIVLTIGLITVLLLPPFFGSGDDFPKASRTAYDVMCLSLVCEKLDDEGFDFESIENLRQLREAVAARTKYGKAEWQGDYLLKTPYGNEYQYTFSKNQDGCFVTLFAEVPDNVPKRFKDKTRRRIKVNCSGKDVRQ